MLEVSDISAGLAYSVIKMLFSRLSRYPMHLSLVKKLLYRVVHSTMMPYSEALRPSPDVKAIRPDIAGIMGAFGAALIARERYGFKECKNTTMLSIDEINELTYTTSMAKCNGCTNNCRLTINKFSGGRRFISGNRCERGLGKEKAKSDVPNLFAYKMNVILVTRH